MRIFIIGFMGSGKTTLGNMLACRLGYRSLDMDREIEREEGMSINEIFTARGESCFRELETGLLKRLIKLDDIVVSTGGGVPCYRDNMKMINANGISIYLEMNREVIFDRLLEEKAERPLIKDMEPDRLYEFIILKLAEREPFYRQAAIIMDAMDFNPEDLIARIWDA